jgi:REG-2-like HAD superfamily hydrolase
MTPKAITFDFYMTLIRPRNEKGRGGNYQDFLAEKRLEAAPWEHQVLYDVFEYYEEEYDTGFSEEDKEEFWLEFSKRIFKRTGVVGEHDRLAEKYSSELCDIFGPNCFELYPDVIPALSALKEKDIQLAVLSNWQKGLEKFIIELGIRDYFTHIIASAEVGFQKPDPAIFAETVRRLDVQIPNIMHIGDSPVDDIQGAQAVGIKSILIDRDEQSEEVNAKIIHDLSEILDLIDGKK